MVLYLVILYIILGLLVFLEASTSYCRLVGYFYKQPASGLILQSSLSLFSRLLMFLFMPLVGYLADRDIFNFDRSLFFLLFIFVLFFLFICLLLSNVILNFYSRIILSIVKHGSLFHFFNIKSNKIAIKKRSFFYLGKKMRLFYLITILAYIPYYLAWPLTFILLDLFNENRGFILGLTSIFNGINTIILALYIDPKLGRIGNYFNVNINLHFDLIKLRLIASFIAWIILLLFI